jgi:hypothetical protein
VKDLKQLATWVPPPMHVRVTALAEREGISVSSLLGELVEEALDKRPDASPANASTRETRPDRIAIRLRPGDAGALVRRTKMRRMRPSTYVAALVRAHLGEDPPLPSKEFAALERVTAELSAVGRNLNQVTRAINSGLPVPAGTAALVGRSIELVEAVREATKAYLRAASASWEAPLG